MGRQHKTLTNLNQHKSTDNTLSKLTGPDGSSGPSSQIAVTDLLLVGSWLSDGDFNYLEIWKTTTIRPTVNCSDSISANFVDALGISSVGWFGR